MLGTVATAVGPLWPGIAQLVVRFTGPALWWLLRVAHWAELDSPRFRLMYDGDDRKKAEARGTEAVFNALILARDEAGRFPFRTFPSTRLFVMWAARSPGGAA